MLGFPSTTDFMDMFGYVTSEDRQRWQAHKEHRAQFVESHRGTFSTDSFVTMYSPAFELWKRTQDNRLLAAQQQSMRATSYTAKTAPDGSLVFNEDEGSSAYAKEAAKHAQQEAPRESREQYQQRMLEELRQTTGATTYNPQKDSSSMEI